MLAGALAAWSTAAAAIACAVLLLGGTLAFLGTPAARAWRSPEPAGRRGRGGALRSSGVRTLCGVLGLMGLVFGAIEVAVPAACEAAGHRHVAGALLSIWGLGSMLGGLLAMRLRRPAAPVARLGAALAAFAVGHLLLPLAGDLVVLGALLMLGGPSVAPSFAAVFGLVDRLAPPGALTEAFAWLTTGIAAGLAAGGALGGWAAETRGADAAMLVAGLAGAAALALAAAQRRTLVPAQ